MPSKTSVFQVRVDPVLLEAFHGAAEVNDIPGAALVRSWMRQYVLAVQEARSKAPSVVPVGKGSTSVGNSVAALLAVSSRPSPAPSGSHELVASAGGGGRTSKDRRKSKKRKR